jgi:hypothetical protein
MRPASQKHLASVVALAVAAALGACSSEFKTGEDGSQSGAGGAGPSGDAGATGDSGGTGTSAGGTGSGGRASGGAEAGDSGGAHTGGGNSGGTDTGGTDTGGSSSGGTDTGGSNSGGTDTGGSSSGGTDTGGSSSGGGGNDTKTGLVINEVDYDNIGTDTAEFIEIYNASNTDISLAGVTLYLINGAGTAPYATVDLSPRSVLKAHGYLIYAPYTLPLAASGEALRIDATPTSNAIQNGSPDGIVLAQNDTVLDVLSYEGAIEAALIPELGTVSLVEKTALSDLVADGGVTDGSLCRSPNGTDTNDSSVDWKFCGKPTPGAANVVDP